MLWDRDAPHNRGDEESVLEDGGSMDKQRRMRAGDASGSDLSVSKIPTVKSAVREAKPTRSTSPNVPQNARPQQRPQRVPRAQATQSDAQILKTLNERRTRAGPSEAHAVADDVAILAPEDTNTRLVLREAVARNAPVFFAVQLQWSVQPMDVKSIPGHPIFSAYTLYAAEGRRAGRTWFFLRLGFFSDAVSAKQVAHYLRRDFASAAVVPVSPQEREQARQMGRCSDAGTIARRPARTART